MKDQQDRQRLPAILIRPEVMRDLEINANEYMVLETVFILSAANGACYKTLKPMARDLAFSKSTCQTIIERLIKRGLLLRTAAGLIADQEYVKAAHIAEDPDLSTKSVRPVSKTRTKSVRTVRNPYNRTKSAPKNNNKNNKSINNTTDVVLAKPVDEIAKLYYQVIKQLELPVKNHSNVRAAIAKLKQELPIPSVLAYLEFLRDHYADMDWEYKPQLNEALDIHGKRLAIRNSLKQHNQSNQTVVIS